MVFSSTTFLFLFLPAVFFFYWLPDVCSKIKQLFSKKPLDNQDPNMALYSQTANPTSSSSPGLTNESNLKEDAAPQSGEAGERSETDDQQEVGSASERQDGKRVVGADCVAIGD